MTSLGLDMRPPLPGALGRLWGRTRSQELMALPRGGLEAPAPGESTTPMGAGRGWGRPQAQLSRPAPQSVEGEQHEKAVELLKAAQGSVKLVVRYTPRVLEEMEARFEKMRSARRRQQHQSYSSLESRG